MKRRETRQIKIGDLAIGSDHPIIIQSMTNTRTSDINATVDQILELEKLGCEIVRVTVNDMAAAEAITEIKSRIHIPLVADIHFDYRLALKAIENGIDKLRINPGNIGDISRIEAVVKACKEKNIPIRIGVNGGSLDPDIAGLFGVTAKGLYESAMKHIRILESLDFYNTIISIKASDIEMTLDAFKMLSDKVDYPFHIGITEAGTAFKGTIKSSIGLGALLLNGLGDTIRVSLTADPLEEIPVCKEILNTLGLRQFGIKLISCPTCGRTQTEMIEIAKAVEKAVAHINKNVSVAIMGCAVNGPGEAKEADLGVACGKNSGLIFKKGEIVKKVPEEDIVATLVTMIENY